MPTYLGYEIFDPAPRVILSQDIVNDHIIRGLVWQKQNKVSPENTERILQLSLVQEGQTERAELREFFKSVRGRLTPFWISSKRTDYRLVVGSGTGQTTLLVNSAAGFQEVNFLKRHLLLANGQMTRVTAGENEPPNSRFTIDDVLTDDLPLNSPVSNFYLVRFETDSLAMDADELSHNPVTTTAVIRLREVQGETP